MSGFEINHDHRHRLQSWKTSLTSRLHSGGNDDREKAVELARLVAYPMQGEIQVSSDLRVEAYFEALETLPSWAVREARQLIVRGETEFGKPWGPGPTEFAELVKLVLSPIRKDLSDIETLLVAEPMEAQPKPGERERVIAGFENAKQEMRPDRGQQLQDDAWAALAKRARTNGVDFETAMDAIEDADKSKSGSFQKLKSA